METLFLERNNHAIVPSVATIGMFDGVHEGHRFVLSHVCDYAKAHQIASTVITFDRHPREVVQTGWHPLLLTTFEERMRLLEETGVDRCVVLPFTIEMAALSARDFMQMMVERLGVKVLLTGYDNRFGHNRSETFDDYVRYGKELGIEVKGLPPTPSEESGDHVSSSMVRRLLEKGDVKEAARCLTYPYSITGRVVKGEHVGTRLGFPTANLQVADPHKMIPAAGVYAVRCMMDDGRSKMYKGMMNIGTRPTFGVHRQTLEVHILDYEGDLYGQTVTVSFIERLRDERRFDNEEELRAQLKEDANKVYSLAFKV
ncbi:MAG: bifunctional riboflavin kinase/FAD synthetase [Prevotella sp.]|nr:bifunctional riboflavin kinase/FAD synthetase [Prevotella sp.]